ncbi:MAG: hypothetical protein EOP04_18250 [Proteobacteria bacterium]|nr:MAG: hypothetical protein EOP04_18250 [Pseudomonadota bacterium]
MNVPESFPPFAEFLKAVDNWNFEAIEGRWSAHSPGTWVARLTGPETGKGRNFCNFTVEAGEYFAIFFSPKSGSKLSEISHVMIIQKEDQAVKSWLNKNGKK